MNRIKCDVGNYDGMGCINRDTEKAEHFDL